MRISKILNNNAAVILDDDGQEVVAIGRGIVYRKKVGDLINPSAIEKKFFLSSQTLNARFQEVLITLPIEEVSVVSLIVDYMRMHIGRRVSDSIYVSLSDHIHYALKNHEKGIYIKNELMFDIIRFYPDEYQIGLKGLDIIEENTGVRLPDDEAGFIALHIVNAETENTLGTSMVEMSTKIIEEVLGIISDFFCKELNEKTLAYYRFVTHLKYFAGRIVNNSLFEDDQKDRELLEMMKKTYTESYLCAKNIQEFIAGKYKVSISKQEMVYLVIHIQRAIFEQ